MNFHWLSWESGIHHCARPWGRGWHSLQNLLMLSWKSGLFTLTHVSSIHNFKVALFGSSSMEGPTKLNSFPLQKLTGRRWLTKEGAPGVVHWNEKQSWNGITRVIMMLSLVVSFNYLLITMCHYVLIYPEPPGPQNCNLQYAKILPPLRYSIMGGYIRGGMLKW